MLSAHINAQWAPTARFVMFDCNTASDDKDVRVFAKDLSECSNFQNVQVWGQTGPAKPSFYPDKRDSSVLRNMGTGWTVNTTYMVASTPGDGFAATRGVPLFSPPALPMKKFINGVLIETAFQNQFNDHRNNVN